jgi:hypothetical protein
MPERVRIECIKKRDSSSHWERISHIGGTNADGRRWLITEERAIEGIKEKRWAFYVDHPGGRRVDVVIAEGPGDRPYLKTKPDKETPNNLLSLPECP